ncbi:MAG: polysaccharide deacetylase family protein [Caulobacteraceae bacterium]
MTLLVTTSWDDGAPTDARLAEHLARFGLKATFYVPTKNAEGRAVMSRAALADLASGFEIGGHAADHVPLTRFSGEALRAQISDNRDRLGDILGQRPRGFCYVQGRFNAEVRRTVAACGYAYARTTRNLQVRTGADPFRMPTTLQFFPHARSVYLRNFLRQGGTGSARLLRRVLGARTLSGRVLASFEMALAEGGCFHLWGHSWELAEHGLWSELDVVLREIGGAGEAVRFVDNAGAAGLAP